jgi:hypothetical protein
MIHYQSLYDFLGKPAGPEVGLAVAKAAKEKGVKIEERQISNSKYAGKILMYPEAFLEDYFNPKYRPIPADYSDKEEDDDLPF